MAGYDIQQPDIVGNFLGRMRDAQQYGQQQEDRATNMRRMGEQDQRAQITFDEGRAAQQAEKVASIAFSLDTPEKWNAFLSDPKNRQEFGLPDTVAQMPFSAREQVIAKAQTLAQQQAGKQQTFSNDLATKKFGLDQQQTAAQVAASRANAAQSYASADASRANAEYIRGGKGQPGGKPLPVRVQTAEDDDISAIQATQSINTQLEQVLGQLGSGDLDLGPVNNFVGGVQNTLGMSTPNSRNLAEFQSTLEKIRNDSLRLNKGVQTEGDAVRAWNEVTKSINDPKVVAQQLQRIKRLNEIAAKQRKQTIDVRRLRNNADPFDFNAINPGAASGAPAPAPAARQAQPTAQPQGGGPRPGTVEDGFEFQGGDPADANNWKPIQ